MHGIQALAASGLIPEPHPYVVIGERVHVESGPLQGVEGILVREKGRDRLVLSVNILARSVSVEVDRSFVHPARLIGTPYRRIMAGAA
jgi:transcription antitermination factor NusG